MKAAAKRLRDEDMKKWTNKRVGEVLGLSTDTIELWFRKPDTTNPKTRNGSKLAGPKPDARVKVNPAAKPKIAAAVKAGKSQAQVAADRYLESAVRQAKKRRFLASGVNPFFLGSLVPKLVILDAPTDDFR